MVSHQEIHIRQFIWAEFRSGKTKKEALENARSKFSADSVSVNMINTWYAHFKAGNNSISDYSFAHAIQTLPTGEEKDLTHSFVFVLDSTHLLGKMLTLDGRLVVFHSDNRNKLVFFDLFHGESKDMPIASTFDYDFVYQMKMINYGHILMHTSTGLIHLKMDYESWNATPVSIYRRRVYLLLVDELNKRRVFIQHDDGISIGTLIGNEFVIGPKQKFDLHDLRWPKLSGDKLIGFRNFDYEEESWQFCQIDLNTLAEERVDVRFDLGDYFATDEYCWAGDRLYVVFNDALDMDREKIFAFNSETLIWTDTGISLYGSIREMFVDGENMLTLQAVQFQNESTFHRFALQKPDSLKNLAWLTVFRAYQLFGGKIFEKIRHRLPFGKGIRSLFVSDYK